MVIRNLKIGESFLLPTSDGGHHLFLVIAFISESRYLCVNITSYREKSDKSCVLEAGSHSFIRHKSVVDYKHAIEIDAQRLDILISTQHCILKGSFSRSLIIQIQQGGLKSKFLKNKYKKLLI